MKLKMQKRLAADVLKCSEKRVLFDETRLEQIKEAITKEDIRDLIAGGAIIKKQKKGVSKSGARYILVQKSKGKRKGHGSRKGKKGARLSRKRKWVVSVRAQRDFLKRLREGSLINYNSYKTLYRKSKGGFFRSVRHIKIFIQEHNLMVRK